MERDSVALKDNSKIQLSCFSAATVTVTSAAAVT